MAAAPARTGIVQWAILGLLAIAALWSIDRLLDTNRAPVARQWPATPFSRGGLAQTHAEALARADQTLADARAGAMGQDQWLPFENLAGAWLARAQLSGDYNDYAAARTALDQAFSLAVKGSGPHMLQAKLDYTMHRLAATEAQLNTIEAYAVPPGRGERGEIAAMRGDIAFYRGRIADALGWYDRADALVPGIAGFHRAILAARTGEAESADAYFVATQAAATPLSPQTRSYLELQRGILDLERRRLAEAMVHLREADRIFPGHWLIEEHIAEVLALQGNTQEAETAYRAIVRRTGNPEFIDALATLVEARGDTAQARQLFSQSAALWKQRIEQFPEAAYGHGFDHCVATRDWPCALRLARQNVEARPYGEAEEMLAKAQLGSGQLAEARATIEKLLATPWRTPEMHRVAAAVYEASGMPAKAAAQARLAGE